MHSYQEGSIAGQSVSLQKLDHENKRTLQTARLLESNSGGKSVEEHKAVNIPFPIIRSVIKNMEKDMAQL